MPSPATLLTVAVFLMAMIALVVLALFLNYLFDDLRLFSSHRGSRPGTVSSCSRIRAPDTVKLSRPGSHVQKRQSERFARPTLAVRVLDPMSALDVSGTVANCSLGGVQLCSETMLPRGRVLEVQFPGNVMVYAMVKHHSHQLGKWVSGCQFVGEIAPQVWSLLQLRA